MEKMDMNRYSSFSIFSDLSSLGCEIIQLARVEIVIFDKSESRN